MEKDDRRMSRRGGMCAPTNGARRLMAAASVMLLITLAALAAPGGPMILQQPQDVVALSGQAVQFSVVASGAQPLTYQWQADGFNIPNAGPYSGAQSATLHINPVTPGVAGMYAVNVTDANQQSTLSNFASLSIAPPPSDECDAAGIIGEGASAYTTLIATTGGPDEPGACLGGTGEFSKDVWFKYGSKCVGTVTVSLCDAEGGSVDFDARLAVYIGCPIAPGTMIACSDNACGGAPRVSFVNNGPTVYRIRVGGADGASGTVMMSITCAPAPCPADVTGDGQVNVSDLLGVIAAWGTTGDPGRHPADVDENGVVNIEDLLDVIAAWGTCA
jgi:hypothetical protein